MGRPKPINPVDVKQRAWEHWREGVTRTDEYYMEYWYTTLGSWYVNFPNKHFGSELRTQLDRDIANEWRPRDLYRHLVRRYRNVNG